MIEIFPLIKADSSCQSLQAGRKVRKKGEKEREKEKKEGKKEIKGDRRKMKEME